jgi:hypothetical protein
MLEQGRPAAPPSHPGSVHPTLQAPPTADDYPASRLGTARPPGR